MRKIIRIGFPILCVSIIGGTFILLNKTAERINRNKLVENEEENIVYQEENVINETVENEIIENEIVENTVYIDEEEAKLKEKENKEKAIEIVKKLAPPLSNTYYTNEGMVGNYYIVAIRDNETKKEKIYYGVDIEKKEIEIYNK